jgi:hypothetical protein
MLYREKTYTKKLIEGGFIDMPQSIQIVPRWSYPYGETIINDYSQVVDKTNNTPIDPVVTYAFPFVSSKGIDNTFVRKHSVSRFVSTFGNTNYKKYGQPLMMPLAVLANPNVYVWGMRVMPVNAAYSNNLITLKYRVDKKSDDVDPSQRKFRINFTQRALTEATNNKEFIDTAYTIQRDPNRAYIPTDDEDPDAPLEVGKYTVKQYVVTTSDDPDAIMVVDDSVENLDSTQVHYTDVISTVYSNNELELVTLQNYVDVYTREHTELSPENIAKILADQLERIDELTPIVEKYRLELDPDEVDLSSEVQAIRNIQVGDYVKVYEWKIAPFMGIRSAGRGVYGDNYRVRISPNTNYEKEYGIKMFDFQILSMEEGLQTVASYTGALSSSDKYESITLINDILEKNTELLVDAIDSLKLCIRLINLLVLICLLTLCIFNGVSGSIIRYDTNHIRTYCGNTSLRDVGLCEISHESVEEIPIINKESLNTVVKTLSILIGIEIRFKDILNHSRNLRNCFLIEVLTSHLFDVEILCGGYSCGELLFCHK